MEEKERYVIGKGEDIFIVDNDRKVIFTITTKKLQDLLNQQSKRIKVLEEENQQLKQQLNDLQKKIVEEIEEEIVKYDLLKNSPNEAGYCMFDSILDKILKKYGGENE